MSTTNLAKSNEPDGRNETEADPEKNTSYLAHIVEDMMTEMGIDAFDNRTSHMLVDILQRESLALLKGCVKHSENRLSNEKEKLLCGNISEVDIPKTNIKITEEDAQLSCQDYLTNEVIQPSHLNDLMDTRQHEDLLVGNKHINLAQGTASRALMSAVKQAGSSNLGYFPNGMPPYLPDSTSCNTLLPNWDIGVKKTNGNIKVESQE